MNENNNLNQMQYNSNQVVYPQNNNNKSKTPIIIAIVIVLIVAAVIAAGAFFILNKDNKKESTKEPEKQQNKDSNSNSNNTNNNQSESSWNGVYENSEGKITLYQADDKTIYYTLSINTWVANGDAKIVNNTATGEIFDTYTFTKNGDEINFTTTREGIQGGTFKKTKEYSKEDYFRDNFGEPSYLNGTINGIFKKNNVTIKIYQTKEDEANLTITAGYAIYSNSIKVVDGNLVLDGESFGETEKINITISTNEITVVASGSDPDSTLNKINGTYTKEKSYTMDDIINNQI